MCNSGVQSRLKHNPNIGESTGQLPTFLEWPSWELEIQFIKQNTLSLYPTGCLFCLTLDKMHPVLSTATVYEHRWRPPFLLYELFFWEGLYLFGGNLLSHCGWRVTPKAVLSNKRCLWNCMCRTRRGICTAPERLTRRE